LTLTLTFELDVDGGQGLSVLNVSVKNHLVHHELLPEYTGTHVHLLDWSTWSTNVMDKNSQKIKGNEEKFQST